MTVNQIENKYIRRGALIALIIPSAVLAFLWEAAKLAVEIARDVPSVFRECWRGR